jgi:hypothetical protein
MTVEVALPFESSWMTLENPSEVTPEAVWWTCEIHRVATMLTREGF